MNAPVIVLLVACIFAAVFIPWAVRNDNLDALESLDDEQLARAWERGDWS